MHSVLYLSYDGMTDPLGRSQVLPYLIGLAKRGYSITLISFEKADRIRAHQSAISEICEQASIDWQPLHYTAKPPVLSTIKDLYLLWRHVRRLHKIQPFQIVHCRSYLTALIGIRLKKKYGTRFLLDMRGFWADERIEGGIWNYNYLIYRFIYKYFKKQELALLSAADHTITLTNQAKSIIHSWGNIPNQPIPIAVIPCCVDLDLFDPAKISVEQKSILKKKLAIPDSVIIISYVGSVGTWYMLPEMLTFFSRWLNRNPDAVFLCITQDNSSVFWNEVNRQQLPQGNFRCVNAVREQMPAFIAISDYSLFFIKPVFSKKASSPTKQGEIMAMGVPLICNTGIGDTDEIILTSASGLLIDSFTTEAYDNAVNQMSQSVFDADRIRAAAQDFFSLEQGIDRYEQVYRTGS